MFSKHIYSLCIPVLSVYNYYLQLTGCLEAFELLP